MIEELLDELLDREGGYVHHPADRGGATCWGVTEAVARAAGYHGPMRRLPREAALAIYRRRYWNAPAFDRVATRAPTLAAELFDTGVNMGPAVAAGFLQRVLNALNRGAADWPDIAVDGRVGPATLSALDRFLARRGPAAEVVLTRACDALQGGTLRSLGRAPPGQRGLRLRLARQPDRLNRRHSCHLSKASSVRSRA